MNSTNAIEVEVHTALKHFIRQEGNRGWPHHLTMARLVARALRLGSSALMQTESSLHRYCLSYLMPALMGDYGVILVAPSEVLQQLVKEEIPLLKKWLNKDKVTRIGDRWKAGDRLLLTTPETWLSDRLNRQQNFPDNILTIIDRAEDLEEWTRTQLTISLDITDWNELLDRNPTFTESIRDMRVELARVIFARPTNRYQCYTLENNELNLVLTLCHQIASKGTLSPKFAQFWQLLKDYFHSNSLQSRYEHLIWVKRDRQQGVFEIFLAPKDVADPLKSVWKRQPVVLIGSFLDRLPKAPTYREKLGLPEMVAVKFAPHQQQDFIRLFVPNRFPLANTPEYSVAVKEKIDILVGFAQNSDRSVVILVEDVPLKGQIASVLAAKYGSKVKVESRELTSNGILVCSWQFWTQHQDYIPTPQLLIMTALPLPSLEHPLVASRVAHYKYKRQDWFRLYLLPTALKMIQQAIIPLRESQGIVALLDSRVNFRSYGRTILSVLEPCARFNYIDPTWFF